MKIFRHILLLTAMAIVASGAFSASAASTSTSNKQERNYIQAGNKLYKAQRYAEAEVQYRKALEANVASETASFNLASALLRQGGGQPSEENKTLQEAMQLLQALASGAKNSTLAELASYDLGNIAYNAQQYQQAIDHYKNALRRNPDNDKARQNLRLAQKKLQDQQNNQDQNKDQNKDQQDQNKDQQDQNKDQNKDQQGQNKDQQDQNKDQQKNQDKQQDQGGISDRNAEQILKAMENEEKATRARVNAAKGKEQEARRRQVLKPW